jgi:hypothetical protein
MHLARTTYVVCVFYTVWNILLGVGPTNLRHLHAAPLHQAKPLGLTTYGRRGRIFYILALPQKKIHVWTLKNFNVIFGPSARRHRQWRRGNTARPHRL